MKQFLFVSGICLLLSITPDYARAQCGMTFNYFYVAGPCDTLQHSVILQISGSTSPWFSVIWENMSTGMSTQLDTGYHTVCVWDSSGCMQCDTFPVNCVDWIGNTGIGESIDESGISVFPDPASGILKINLRGSDHNTSIVIVDHNGRQMKKVQWNSGETILVHISDLPSGLYFIRCSNDKQYFNKKFFKD